MAGRRAQLGRLFDAVYTLRSVGRFNAFDLGQSERRRAWSLAGRAQAVRAAEQSLLPRIGAFNQRARLRVDALRRLLTEAG